MNPLLTTEKINEYHASRSEENIRFGYTQRILTKTQVEMLEDALFNPESAHTFSVCIQSPKGNNPKQEYLSVGYKLNGVFFNGLYFNVKNMVSSPISKEPQNYKNSTLSFNVKDDSSKELKIILQILKETKKEAETFLETHSKSFKFGTPGAEKHWGFDDNETSRRIKIKLPVRNIDEDTQVCDFIFKQMEEIEEEPDEEDKEMEEQKSTISSGYKIVKDAIMVKPVKVDYINAVKNKYFNGRNLINGTIEIKTLYVNSKMATIKPAFKQLVLIEQKGDDGLSSLLDEE